MFFGNYKSFYFTREKLLNTLEILRRKISKDEELERKANCCHIFPRIIIMKKYQ